MTTIAETKAGNPDGGKADGRLAWTFGPHEVDRNVAMTKSSFRAWQALEPLLSKGEEPWRVKSEIATSDARRHIGEMFPDLMLTFLTPGKFKKEYREFAGEEVNRVGALLTRIYGVSEKYDLAFKTQGAAGKYVAADVMMEMIGRYALEEEGDVHATEPPNWSAMPGMKEGRSLLSAHGVPPCDGCLATATALLAGYVFAHFVGLDTRVITLRFMRESESYHTIEDIGERLLPALRNTLTSESGMDAFLARETGATREAWNCALPEQKRRMLTDAAVALLKHGLTARVNSAAGGPVAH